MKKVIVMSVNNEGGDDGSYCGKVIGVLECIFDVEVFDVEVCKEKCVELYYGDDEDEDVIEEFEEVDIIDKNYDLYLELNDSVYCFKVIK